MPRPKVRLEDRQRSSQACDSCKSSKIRCNSGLPCETCVRRNRSQACSYTDLDRRRRSSVREVPHKRVETRSNNGSQPSISSSNQTMNSYIAIDSSPASMAISPSTAAQCSQPPQDNLSADDNILDKACSPSLSFLRFLQKTLRPFAGPSVFTDTLLEVAVPQINISLDSSTATRFAVDELYKLMSAYAEATSGLIDLFTATEVDVLIAEKVQPTEKPGELTEDDASLNVALAIGAQMLPEYDVQKAQVGRFISNARQIAFDGLLANPTLSMVRLFLLLAFQMLGTCHRNAASMYLGVSARAAILLKLHEQNPATMLAEECDKRTRLWNSLKTFEVLTSFILGCVPSVPGAWHKTTAPAGETTASTTPQTACKYVTDGSRQIENIIRRLRSGNVLHVPTAETLLKDLRNWIQSLPTAARVFQASKSCGLDAAERQALVGNIHISGVYYFAVILITRPFLVAYLLSRLRGRAPDHLIEDPDEAADVTIKNSPVSQLAQVCVSSAIHMTDTCRKARQLGLSFGNLYLISAWTFGSGLVLGFSMFAGEPRQDIEEAFAASIDVLKEIAEKNAQAQSYCIILESFSDAVSSYRCRVANQVQRTVQHYMEQVMVIEAPAIVELQATAGLSEGFPASEWEGSSSLVDNQFGQQPCGVISAMDVGARWDELDFAFDSPNVVQELAELENLLYSIE